jgi:hypothetical protein
MDFGDVFVNYVEMSRPYSVGNDTRVVFASQ